MKTKLCELLNIEKPILQGGMAWISDANLAGAVSEAGGLGIISAMNADKEYLRNEIAKLRKMTSKPFGVNIMLMSPHADEIAKLVIEEKVPVVTTGAGNPSKYMEDWNKAGIKVIPVVPSTGMAKLVAKKGAAAVIAEGGESGGHVGEITTMVLVPQVCDVVDIPVIAAGGIGDGRGFVAALALGACGVQLGTKFLVSKECNIHQNYKDRILKAKDIDTVATGKRLGHPVRSLKTAFSREFMKKEYDSSISNEELESLGSGALRKAAVEGDLEQGCFMSGQIAGMIIKEETVLEIMNKILDDSNKLISEVSKWAR